MVKQFNYGGDIVWEPTDDYIENANLTRFMRLHNITDFDELIHRSTEDIAWFTEALINYLNIRFYRPYTQVLNLSSGISWPTWCVDGKMNIVHNCVDKYMGTQKESQTAVVWESEAGVIRKLNFAELNNKVNQTANALRFLGLGKGDPVGIYMPMIPEIVSSLLAIAKIGGIILPLFSGYGTGAVSTRLKDAGAKALITADGFIRRGKPIAMKQIADKVAISVPTLKHIIVYNNTNIDVNMISGRDHWWHEIVEKQSIECETEITNAEDPLMVIYTSGTTGQPKGAVHTHCGFPIKAAQDMAFGTDLHQNHIIYWMTDMGWMMGPWLVFGATILGGTLFIYDGAPDYPSHDRLWAMIDRHQITTLGLSPTFVRSMIPHGEERLRKHNLSSLRYFASTGEPWNPDSWLWLFEKVGASKRPIINYSGGTEISGGIVMGNPLRPLKPCAFSGPCPGIAADVFDENGTPIKNQVGELVIKAPWIGMTRGFWKDPLRYEKTFWSRWQNIWVHGDFAAIDSDGLWYILGRSDDTIKVAGKRLGPAEVESILVNHSDVVEAAAIGIPDEIKGNALIVFCVLTRGCNECDEIRQELKDMVTEALGKPLTPRDVLFVSDLPKTRNAKVMRRVIRAAYLGDDPGDTSSLLNPEAVEKIHQAI